MTNGTVFFPANTTTQTINISILGDQNQTQTESFNVVLSNQSIGTISRSTATVTLFNVAPGSLPPDEFDTASGETDFTADTSASGPFAPADPSGAVGPTDLVVFDSDTYQAFNKSTGTVLQSSTLNQFWTNAGITLAGDYVGQPHVVYDPATGRWYAAVLDQSIPPGSAGPAVNTDNILLAVSKTSDPTQGWVGLQGRQRLDRSQPGRFRFARFQRLVGRRHGQHVQHCTTARSSVTPSFRFPRPTSPERLRPSAGHLQFQRDHNGQHVRSGRQLRPRQHRISHHRRVGRPRPGVDYRRRRPDGRLQRPKQPDRRLRGWTDPDGRPAAAPQPARRSAYHWTHRADHRRHGRPARRLNSNFTGTAVQVGGDLWAAQTVSVGGTDEIQWFEINTSNNQILQHGLIAGSNGLNFYYPSVSTDTVGDVVIGFSGSSLTQQISSYAYYGTTTKGVTTFTGPILLKQGTGIYAGFSNANVVSASINTTSSTFANNGGTVTIGVQLATPAGSAGSVVDLGFSGTAIANRDYTISAGTNAVVNAGRGAGSNC